MSGLPKSVRVTLTSYSERDLMALPVFDRHAVRARLKGLPEDPWIGARRRSIPPRENQRYLVALREEPSRFFVTDRDHNPYYAVIRAREGIGLLELVVETVCTQNTLDEELRKLIEPVKSDE